MKERRRVERAIRTAAWLPTGDPLREQVEEACAADPTLAARWLELVSESERTRVALHGVAVPSGLVARLLDVPRQTRRQWRLPIALAVAAALVLALLFVGRGAPMEQRLRTLAVLAIHTHVNDPPTLPRRDDPRALSVELSARVPFPVRVSPPAAGLRLVGGKCCTFERRPVAYTLWRGPSGPVSLVQFRRSDFDLPAVERRGVPGDDEAHRVTAWTEGDLGFLLVADR